MKIRKLRDKQIDKAVAEKRKDTREKRLHQKCRVFELKIDESHLSDDSRQYLFSLFVETKWLYNNMVAAPKLKNFDYKTKQVTVLDKDKVERIEFLKHLSSQMKQGLWEESRTAVNKPRAYCAELTLTRKVNGGKLDVN